MFENATTFSDAVIANLILAKKPITKQEMFLMIHQGQRGEESKIKNRNKYIAWSINNKAEWNALYKQKFITKSGMDIEAKKKGPKELRYRITAKKFIEFLSEENFYKSQMSFTSIADEKRLENLYLQLENLDMSSWLMIEKRLNPLIYSMSLSGLLNFVFIRCILLIKREHYRNRNNENAVYRINSLIEKLTNLVNERLEQWVKYETKRGIIYTDKELTKNKELVQEFISKLQEEMSFKTAPFSKDVIDLFDEYYGLIFPIEFYSNIESNPIIKKNSQNPPNSNPRKFSSLITSSKMLKIDYEDTLFLQVSNRFHSLFLPLRKAKNTY